MLHCFDIDGTLVRSFMRENTDATCPDCGVRHGSEHWDNCGLRLRTGERMFGVDDYDRIEVLQGRWDRLYQLSLQSGSRFALVTNQAGVAFGYQTVEQVYRKVALVAAEFWLFFRRPWTAHIAFHHPRATVDAWKCMDGDPAWDRRKPGPGMLVEAMTVHRVDTATTWFVGDMDSDRLAATAAGVRYFDAEEFFR